MEHAIPHVRIVENVSFRKFRDEILPGNVPVLLTNWMTGFHAAEFSARDEALDALRKWAGRRELEEVQSGTIRFGRRSQAWQRN